MLNESSMQRNNVHDVAVNYIVKVNAKQQTPPAMGANR